MYSGRENALKDVNGTHTHYLVAFEGTDSEPATFKTS